MVLQKRLTITDRDDVELIKSYFKYNISELRNIFYSIKWISEDECPKEGMKDGDYRRYIKRYKNASDLFYVLRLGSYEALLKLDKEIDKETNSEMKKYEKQMYRLTGDGYYKHTQDYTFNSNIETEGGKYVLKLINHTDYLINPDWEYGFVFNLDNDTFEIHSRKLMEQNGADNMVWKVITRDTVFDEDAFELE